MCSQHSVLKSLTKKAAASSRVFNEKLTVRQLVMTLLTFAELKNPLLSSYELANGPLS
jgi:hypothetical protein